jgi:hypothetical protein
MRGINSIHIYPESSPTSTSPPPSYDLIVTDTEKNLDLDTKFIFSTGFIPPDLQNILREKQNDITIVDWKKEDPLLRHTQLGELSIMEGTEFVNGNSEKNLEKQGYQTIIFGSQGPLLLKKEWADQTSYNLLFNISKSTLPFRIAFPIMIKNLVELARKKAGLSDVIADKTGILPEMILLPKTSYTITTPTNEKISEKSADDGRLPAITAPLTGIYKLNQGSKAITDVGVSLLSKTETTLSGTDKITFSELSVNASDTSAKAPLSLWKYLAILALIILCIEWWFFNKKH